MFYDSARLTFKDQIKTGNRGFCGALLITSFFQIWKWVLTRAIDFLPCFAFSMCMHMCVFAILTWKTGRRHSLLFLTSVHLPFEAPIRDFIKKKQTAAVRKCKGRRSKKNWWGQQVFESWRRGGAVADVASCCSVRGCHISPPLQSRTNPQIKSLCCGPGAVLFYFSWYLSPGLFLSCSRSLHPPMSVLAALFCALAIAAVSDGCQPAVNNWERGAGKAIFIHMIEVL